MTDLRPLAEAAKADTLNWYNADFLRSLIDGDDEALFSDADCAFIAAVSPDVVLDLLDDRDALRRQVAVADGAYEAGLLDGEGSCRDERDALRAAVALLNSMVLSGEAHSPESEAIVRAALGPKP